MHGHGYTQPVTQPPHTGWLAFLRVLFVVISVFSIGFLAWTMLLRLAIVTRKSLDWGLFVAVLAADVLSIVLLGTEPGEEVHTVGGWTGIALLLGTLVAAIAYYLAADIRHFHQLRHGPYGAARPPAYGYPQATSAYGATTTPRPGPHTPPPAPQGPAPQPPHHTPIPQPPTAAPGPPQRPAPARIDQVRAELDELSDYLRRQDGTRESDSGGGR
ncbi:hypothetical protein [Streptomyces griseus]|uniref:hypothetical protein n=1 Tax=Streptomyces griseus TaxID=1911 RepID=UPI00056A73B8|nr:hypothetical protein [Streptomyces griseus]